MEVLFVYICVFLLISVSNCAQNWIKEVSDHRTSEGGYASIIWKSMNSLRVRGAHPYRVHILDGK